MPNTPINQFRLGPQALDQLVDLCHWWGGPVQTLTHTAAVREAIRRAHQAEARKRARLAPQRPAVR